MQVIVRDTVSTTLEVFGARGALKKHAAEAMGLVVVSLATRSFNEPALRASPWPALQESTIREKARRGLSSSILKAHGILWRSWRVADLGDDFVKVGSDRPYAGYHQWGTARGLPARPMLPLEGGPANPRFAPFAVRRLVSAARASIEGAMNRRPPSSPSS